MKKMMLTITSVFLVLCLLCSAFPIAAAEIESGKSESSLDNDLQIKSTNSLGAMVTDELEEVQSEQESNKGINVFSVEMDGNIANAEFETTRDAELVVGIYSEDGSVMYASGKTEITKDDTTAQVLIDIAEMPQYFFVKAYIIDTNTFKPLCSVYNCPNYTQEMQEFLSKTTDDFEQDKVLNLDNSEENNFAVYNESVVMLDNADGKNTIVQANDETKVYVIENADETLTSLTAGQTFSCGGENNELVIVKIASISVDGTTVTVTGADVNMNEVFDYVKIDGSEITDSEFDDSGLDEDVAVVDEGNGDEPLGDDGIGGEVTLKRTYEIKKENQAETKKLKGSLEFSVTIGVKVYISTTQQYLELKMDYGVEVKLSASAEFKRSIPLGEFSMHVCLGVFIKFKPSFVFECEGSLEVSGKLSGSFGFRASMQNGKEDISKKPKFESEIKAEVKVFIGLSMEPTVSVLLDAVTAKLTAKAGVEVTASMSAQLAGETDTSQIHDCSRCVTGEIKVKFDLSFEVKFLKSERMKLEFKLVGLEFKISDFYYSQDYGEFGFSTCKHIKYQVVVIVVNELHLPVEGAVVNGTNTTDKFGHTSFYCYNGSRSFTAVKDSLNASATVKVNGKPASVAIVLSGAAGSGSPGSGSSGGGSSVLPSPALSGDVAAVEAGYYHSAALMTDGTLYTWGYNGYGQLGIGSTTSFNTPRKVNGSGNGLAERSVKQISLGYYHSAAITKDGSLYTWGYNADGQLGNGNTSNTTNPAKIMDNVKQVSLGLDHSAAVTRDGSLYTWGNNGYGQLGNGSTTNSSVPVKIMDNVEQVILGGSHSAAITKDGSLYTWGYNYYGQLGNGSTANSYVPVKIMENIQRVELGSSHSAALDTDGNLYVWGYNDYGQVGNSTSSGSGGVSRPFKAASHIKSFSLGSSHTLAVNYNGDLYAWGYNYYGQLGERTTTNRTSPKFIQSNIASVSGGGRHTLALSTDGRVLSCGYNYYGQLGLGDSSIRGILTEVPLYDHTPGRIDKAGGSLSANDNNSVGAGTAKTVTFNGYKPGGIYNFYSMKNKDDGLSSDNLLFISQVTANDNGSVTITYTGTQAYNNPAEFLESLEAVDISDLSVEAPQLTYNGYEQFYEPVIKNGGYELCEGIDYTFEGIYHATDAGEYTVNIVGKGVFTGSRAAVFTIAPYDIGSAKTEGENEFTYNGSDITPEITVSDEHRELVKDKDYTVSYQNNKYPGVAVASINGTGNYTGRKVVYFDILSCDIGKNSTVELESVPFYSGQPITPDFTLTVNGNVLTKDTDYTVNYHNNVNKGIGIIEIKGIGGCEGRVVCWFDITECDIGEAGYCSPVKYQVYDGGEQNPEPVVIVQGKRLVKGVDYTLSYSDNLEVGVATITVNGMGSYKGTLTTTFDITDKRYGDVNLDGIVSIGDVTVIQRYLAEFNDLTDEQLALADTNGDGVVNISDATHLQKFIADFNVKMG